MQAILRTGSVRRPFWPGFHAVLIILGLSHAKSLRLAVQVLIRMRWARQDIAVLQAVLLAGGIHSIILRVRVLKSAGHVPDVKRRDEACSEGPAV